SSLDLSGISIDLNRVQFREIIRQLQEKNGMENGAFKVIATGGYSDTLSSVTGTSNLLILNVDWKKPPEATFEKGIHLIRDRFVRPHPLIKTLYYFNTLRLQKKMQETGAVDVMFHTETITEASRANLFFVKRGRISTPGQQILRGITRKQVLTMFEEVRVEEVENNRLYDFDEVFMTATSRDITPVVKVDGRKIGNGMPGPVTREIQDAFRLKGW
ncbi:MAG: aminotransferase class IV, partial [Bacteroidales bacterium]